MRGARAAAFLVALWGWSCSDVENPAEPGPETDAQVPPAEVISPIDAPTAGDDGPLPDLPPAPDPGVGTDEGPLPDDGTPLDVPATDDGGPTPDDGPDPTDQGVAPDVEPIEETSPVGDTGAGETTQVDLLFVVDNTNPMCEEQIALAEAFAAFADALQSAGPVDFRLAVVSTDLSSPTKAGRFKYHRTTSYPYSCAVKKTEYCVWGPPGVPMCEAVYGDGWVCDAPQEASWIMNCNGSMNSGCRMLCSADHECDAAFVSAAAGEACKSGGDCTYTCLMPGGNPAVSGCVPRPPGPCPGTDEIYAAMALGGDPAVGKCAGDGSACGFLTDPDGAMTVCLDGSLCMPTSATYLTPSTATGLFPCVAAVGVEASVHSNLEQGLKAAVSALDASGPNATQASQFLRPDAHLGIVFLSDEEDCSMGEGQTMEVPWYPLCLCLGDTDSGGPLGPVSELVSDLKGLKANPDKVLVGVIVGDSLAASPAEQEAERVAFQKAKCGDCDNPDLLHPLKTNTTICGADNGKADHGKRYLEVVAAFGDNGVAKNICSPAGVGPGLVEIGSYFAGRLSLP